MKLLQNKNYFALLVICYGLFVWIYTMVHKDDCLDNTDSLKDECQMIIHTVDYDNIIRKFVLQGVDLKGKSKIFKMDGLIIFDMVSYGDTLIKVKNDSIFTVKSKNKVYRFYPNCNHIGVDSVTRIP